MLKHDKTENAGTSDEVENQSRKSPKESIETEGGHTRRLSGTLTGHRGGSLSVRRRPSVVFVYKVCIDLV